MKLVNAHLQQLRGEDKLKIAQLMADLESKNSVRAWQGEVGVGAERGKSEDFTNKYAQSRLPNIARLNVWHARLNKAMLYYCLSVCLENFVAPAIPGQNDSREEEENLKICESPRSTVFSDCALCYSDHCVGLFPI